MAKRQTLATDSLWPIPASPHTAESRHHQTLAHQPISDAFLVQRRVDYLDFTNTTSMSQ
jgi:hypothetical protein